MRGGILLNNTHGAEHRSTELQARFQRFRNGNGCPGLQQLLAVLPVTPACVDGDARVMLPQDTDQPHGRYGLVKRAYQCTGLSGTCCLQYIDLAGITVEDREAVPPAFQYAVCITFNGEIRHIPGLQDPRHPPPHAAEAGNDDMRLPGFNVLGADVMPPSVLSLVIAVLLVSWQGWQRWRRTGDDVR